MQIAHCILAKMFTLQIRSPERVKSGQMWAKYVIFNIEFEFFLLEYFEHSIINV